MDCSVPAFLVLHCLPEFAQTRPLSWWCHPTISSSYRWIPCCVVLSCFSQAWLFMTSCPGSSIHGIFPARILEWVAMAFSRGSSWPGDQTLCLLSLLALQVDFLLLSHLGSPGEPWSVPKSGNRKKEKSIKQDIFYLSPLHFKGSLFVYIKVLYVARKGQNQKVPDW